MSYFLGGRKVRSRLLTSPSSSRRSPVSSRMQNPNGCTPRMTYYTSLSYTNYSMVTEM